MEQLALPGLDEIKSKSGATLKTWLVIVLAAVALLTYSNTLWNGYALDDFSVISKNSIVVNGASAIPEIFRTPYRRGFVVTANDFYRPMSLAMFAMEYQISDGKPWIGHLMNILFFAGCVLLLFLFLDTLFNGQRTWAVFLAAVLFAVHPIHTEVVANIKSRDELLCFFFSMAATNLFLVYSKTGAIKNLVAGAFLYFLALLSKETALTYLALFPLVFFIYKRDNTIRSSVLTIVPVITALVFLGIRASVLSTYHTTGTFSYVFSENMLAGAATAATRYATAVLILGKYLQLLCFPYPLVCDHSYSSVSFVQFGNIGVLITLLIYIVAFAYGIYRAIRHRKDPYVFGILYFLITISIFTNIPFLIGAAMAERFVFFASAGFCLLAGLLAARAIPMAPMPEVFRRPRNLLLPGLILLTFTGMTLARNADWHDGDRLFRTDLKKAPDNFRLNYYLGEELLLASEQEGDTKRKVQLVDEGVSYLKRSIAIYGGYSVPLSEVGNSYLIKTQYDSAELYFRRALAIAPGDLITTNKLAGIYFKAGKYRQSLELCQVAVGLDPRYARGYRNMGSCYLHLGKYDSAVIALKTAIPLEPEIISTYEYLATAYDLAGRADSAAKYRELVTQLKTRY